PASAWVADAQELEEHHVLARLVGTLERALEEPHLGDRPQHGLAFAQRQAGAERPAIEATHGRLLVALADGVLGEALDLELLAEALVATLGLLDLPVE